VLGAVGYNMGAGMTGGDLFVWDPEIERLLTRVNTDLVEVARPDHEAFETLRWLVQRHVELTASTRAKLLMAEWPERLDQLWHIVPRDRQRLITQETAQRVATA
jgi:glutamate synthase domain-containing protein 3